MTKKTPYLTKTDIQRVYTQILSDYIAQGYLVAFCGSSDGSLNRTLLQKGEESLKLYIDNANHERFQDFNSFNIKVVTAEFRPDYFISERCFEDESKGVITLASFHTAYWRTEDEFTTDINQARRNHKLHWQRIRNSEPSDNKLKASPKLLAMLRQHKGWRTLKAGKIEVTHKREWNSFLGRLYEYYTIKEQDNPNRTLTVKFPKEK